MLCVLQPDVHLKDWLVMYGSHATACPDFPGSMGQCETRRLQNLFIVARYRQAVLAVEVLQNDHHNSLIQ